jgi:hypothetical protein
MTILGGFFNKKHMFLTCVLDVSNWKKNLKYKYRGLRPKISRRRNFYKIKKIGADQFLRGERLSGDNNLSIKLNWPYKTSMFIFFLLLKIWYNVGS